MQSAMEIFLKFLGKTFLNVFYLFIFICWAIKIFL